MKNKIIWIYVGLIFIAILGIYVTLNYKFINTETNLSIVCNTEAKMCPDGSYVGRTGLDCHFAACPVSQNSGEAEINQKISLSGVSITPIKVVSDSRCPSGVQCVRAGTVLLKVKLEKEGGIQEADLELGKAITFAGERVLLENVLPEKGQSEIKSSEYVFKFSVKPSSESKSIISGRVTLSPTCPVERFPNDPNCNPKGYDTTVSIRKILKVDILVEVKTDKNGNFSIELSPGKYTLNANSANNFPTCLPQNITVVSGQNLQADISCDSGIR